MPALQRNGKEKGKTMFELPWNWVGRFYKTLKLLLGYKPEQVMDLKHASMCKFCTAVFSHEVWIVCPFCEGEGQKLVGR